MCIELNNTEIISKYFVQFGESTIDLSSLGSFILRSWTKIHLNVSRYRYYNSKNTCGGSMK